MFKKKKIHAEILTGHWLLLLVINDEDDAVSLASGAA